MASRWYRLDDTLRTAADDGYVFGEANDMTAPRRGGVRGMAATLRLVLNFRPIELDPVACRLRGAANVDDLRRLAKRRLPHGVFDYIDGAAEDERTMAANRAGFADLTFCPRVLTGVGEPDPSTTLLGETIPLPIVLAPTGFTRLAHSEGELAVARAAARPACPTRCRRSARTRSKTSPR